MLAAMLLSVLAGVPAAQPDAKKDAPAKQELFAAENWYKGQAGEEQQFIGVLKKVANKGKAGIGRMNAYVLQSTRQEKVPVVVKVDGKAVTEYRHVEVTFERDVYVAGKNDILDSYVGKHVLMVGKAVTLQLEGRTYNEIWPARIEVLPEAKKLDKLPGAQEDEGCCDMGDNAKELKIHAKTRWQYVSSAPDGDKKGKQFAMRSAAELVANTPFKGRDGTKEAVEKAATEELAKALKVTAIDWSKQMLVVVTGGVKSSGGWRIDISKVAVDGKTASVLWSLSAPEGFATQAFTHPSLVALVDRCEGEVTFIPTATVKPKGDPLPK